METDPSLEDAVVRSRKLGKDEMLSPPADFPVLFTCLYLNQTAIGCVFRNGGVMIMPDYLGPRIYPCMFSSMRWVEESPDVTDITWEWGVVRFPDAKPQQKLRVVSEDPTLPQTSSTKE